MCRDWSLVSAHLCFLVTCLSVGWLNTIEEAEGAASTAVGNRFTRAAYNMSGLLCCQITILLPVTLTAMMPDFKITCVHQSISVCLPTINALAWPTNMHELQSPFLWCMTSLTTQVWTSQFLFSLCMSSSQPFSHFLFTFLENTFSWFLPAGCTHSSQPAGPKIALHFVCLFVGLLICLSVRPHLSHVQ